MRNESFFSAPQLKRDPLGRCPRIEVHLPTFPLSSEVFWVALGSVAAVATMLAGLGRWVVRRLSAHVDKQVAPLLAENERLRADIDVKLRLPSYSLDAVRLTEVGAQRRIEELQREYDAAVVAKDKELANALNEKLREIEHLRSRLNDASQAHTDLEAMLQTALFARQTGQSHNAVGLPNGVILAIRYQGRYAAIQAIDQTGERRGCLIRYGWWYQPDGTGLFTTASTECGFGIAGERNPYRPPMLKVGPLDIAWSMGADGQGWVYFGKQRRPPVEYELALTREVDISRVDAAKLSFRSYEPPAPGHGLTSA